MSTQAATSVTALSPINLGNGNSALITPWPEFVQVQVYENAKAASDEYLREAKYSYEEYENLRQQNPHVKLPELKKPPAPTKNPNSGPAGRLPPTAVSLTPNVRLARIYTMPVRPVEPPANQPKDVAGHAQHAAGVAVGAAQAVGGGVLAAATVMSDSILQIGDLLTAGYYRDTGLVQSALQRQSSLGSAIERAARHPIDTAAGVLNDLEAKRQQAEALRAAGDFYEAGKVSGTILADAYPGGGAAAGMVRRVPHGEQLPAAKHGTDGVAILKSRAHRLEELAMDPAQGGKITTKTRREAEVGLALEESGKLPGPIVRDPTAHQGAEFIDVTGQKWDVKGPMSEVPSPSGRGAYELNATMRNIGKEFKRGYNVIIDTANMSNAHIRELSDAINASGSANRVIWY
ncbi:hypothetical protein GCM10027276_07870 [Comamonas piscis]